MSTGHDVQGVEDKGVCALPGTSPALGMRGYGWAVFLLVWPAVGIFLLTRGLAQAEAGAAKQALAARVVRLEALRKADREALDHYRWIDCDRGWSAFPSSGRWSSKRSG